MKYSVGCWLVAVCYVSRIVSAEDSDSVECNGVKLPCMKSGVREHLHANTDRTSADKVLEPVITGPAAHTDKPTAASTVPAKLQRRATLSKVLHPWLRNFVSASGRAWKKHGVALVRDGNGKNSKLERQLPNMREARIIRLLLLLKTTIATMGIFLMVMGIKKFLVLVALLYKYKWTHHDVEVEHHHIPYDHGHFHDHGHHHDHGHGHHGDPYWGHGHHDSYKNYGSSYGV